MSELDGTDVEIVQHLLEDARRSYREIADEVGLSPPAVSNRVERLQELGVVRRFTVDLNRTRLSNADERLLFVETRPDDVDAVASRLESVAGVEHVFQTVDAHVVADATLSPSEIHALFADELDEVHVEDYRTETVLDSAWHPQLGAGEFDVECVICGNTVTSDGETVEVDAGDAYRVCCSSCAETVVEQYQSLKEGVEG
jgi:DNA-binding Lrp family transcriptional regulator